MSFHASPSDSKARLPMLDGLRGICAICVMIYHCYMWNGTDQFQVGKFGVYFFFMLSGFSMWYVYHQRELTAAMLRRFFVARVARIAPLYLLTVMVMLALNLRAAGLDALNPVAISNFTLNASLLFGFALPGKYSFVTGGWSIGVEWVFYITFPLWLLFVRRLRVALGVLAVAIVVNQLYVAAIISNGTIATQQEYYLVFATFIVYFAAGITGAFLFERYGHLVARPLLRLIPFAVLAFIFTFPVPTNEALLVGWHYPLLIALSIGALVIAAGTTRLAPLEARIYTFLGEISYGTYLLHFIVYSSWMMVARRLHLEWSVHAHIALVAVASVTIAYLVFRFFEAPARTYINRRA